MNYKERMASFMAAAITGLAANPGTHQNPEEIAGRAYQIALAMMDQLDGREQIMNSCLRTLDDKIHAGLQSQTEAAELDGRKGSSTMKNAGFTLIELIIAAAMIGILATLAIANYSMFKAGAYNTAAASDARNLSPAVEMVASEPEPPPLIMLGGGGGVIPEIPGATSSPNTFGTIEIANNHYRIKTYQLRGNLCYTLHSVTGLTVTSGACSQ